MTRVLAEVSGLEVVQSGQMRCVWREGLGGRRVPQVVQKRREDIDAILFFEGPAVRFQRGEWDAVEKGFRSNAANLAPVSVLARVSVRFRRECRED